jgi:hypothetical protein
MNLETTANGFKEMLLVGGALIVMAIGVIGVILPILPGLPLVWGAAFAYGYFTGFKVITQTYLLNFGLASAALIILDFVFRSFGAQKMGSSKWGMFGAFLGMVVGIVIGTLPSLILGSLVGATLFEMMLGKGLLKSLSAGCGTFIAFLIGTILQLALALVMVGVFIQKVLIK